MSNYCPGDEVRVVVPGYGFRDDCTGVVMDTDVRDGAELYLVSASYFGGEVVFTSWLAASELRPAGGAS